MEPPSLTLYTFTQDDDSVETLEKRDSLNSLLFTETFNFDADGNLLTRHNDGSGVTTTYSWDGFDKLVAVSSADSGGPTNDAKQQNSYLANGFRRKKKAKDGTVTTEYATGLSTALAKKESETLTYIKGHQILGFEQGSTFYFFLHDQLGSVRDIVRGTDGAVLQSYDYTENGDKTVANPSAIQSDKTFVGGLSVNDDTADSGLYLMGHRFYDPSLGRFLNRDPIGFSGGLNLYSYAGNRPSSAIDPTGLDWVEEVFNALGVTLEYTGYMTTMVGLAAQASGPPLMLAGAGTASSGVGAPAGGGLFGAGLAAELSSPWVIAGGVSLVGAGKSLQMMSQAKGLGNPCPTSGTSGGNPALRGDPYHPQSVADRIHPPYRANPKHNPLAPHRGASPEPADSVLAYARAIRSKSQTWWSKVQDNFYRYSHSNDGTTHYSGTFPGNSPQVPNHVKKHNW